MGMQTYVCPLCAGRHYLHIGGEGVGALQQVIARLNSKHARSILRAAGIRNMPKGIDVRDARKLAERIDPSRRSLVEADQPRMLAALIVTHKDGKASRFIAQSAGEDLDLHELPGAYKVAHEYINRDDAYLTRLFGGERVRREQTNLPGDDFTTNCGAIKVLLAVSKGLGQIRKGTGKGALVSDAPIVNLSLSEEVYRPFTSKITSGWRQYTRGDFDDPETTHLAPSCPRCKSKVPVLICPVARRTKRGLEIYETAKGLVEVWETEYHSQPWGVQGADKTYMPEA